MCAQDTCGLARIRYRRAQASAPSGALVSRTLFPVGVLVQRGRSASCCPLPRPFFCPQVLPPTPYTSSLVCGFSLTLPRIVPDPALGPLKSTSETESVLLTEPALLLAPTLRQRVTKAQPSPHIHICHKLREDWGWVLLMPAALALEQRLVYCRCSINTCGVPGLGAMSALKCPSVNTHPPWHGSILCQFLSFSNCFPSNTSRRTGHITFHI